MRSIGRRPSSPDRRGEACLAPTTRVRCPARRVAALLALLALPVIAAAAGDGRVERPAAPGQPYVYQPTLAVSPSLQPFIDDITPGNDLFPDERIAGELIEQLSRLREKLEGGSDRARAADPLLAPSFKGGRLWPADATVVSAQGPLVIHRANAVKGGATLDARGFGRELARLLEDFRTVRVAEFLLTTLDLQAQDGPRRH